MSEDVKLNLTRLGVIIGILAALTALLGSFFILPYRVEASEKRQDAFESKTDNRFSANEAEQKQQRDILIRIDENVKELRRITHREP